MKRKSEKEIRAAKKPSDIFSMDLNSIEQEKEEYLEAFKPKEYHTIENFITTRKVLLLYNEAINELSKHTPSTYKESDKVCDNFIAFNRTTDLFLPEKFDSPRTTDSVLADSISIIESSCFYSSKAAAISNYLISESILNSFRNVSFSFSSYTDELERKNKLDEYYMLFNEIDKYDNTLIEFGCIEDAYNNLQLVQYPTINTDIRNMWILINLTTEEGLSKILDISKHQLANPIKILSDIMNHKNTFYFGDKLLHAGPNNCIRIPLDAQIIRENFDFRFVVYSLLDISDLHFDIDRNLSYYEDSNNNPQYLMTFKPTETEEFIKRILEFIYNSLDESSFKNLLWNDSYYKTVEFINSLNMDILLMNLRNLHSGLRNQVRKFKIDKSIS